MKKSFYSAIVAVMVLFTVQNVSAIECVQYVKQQKPAYNKLYPVKKDGKASGQKVYWVPANELWNNLWVQSRGADPTVGSVFIIEKNFELCTNAKGQKTCSFLDPITNKTAYFDVGHTGIVTGVSNNGKRIDVKHANWDTSGGVSTGYFYRSSTSTDTWNYVGTKGQWKNTYRILGFVYTP